MKGEVIIYSTGVSRAMAMGNRKGWAPFVHWGRFRAGWQILGMCITTKQN